MKYILHFIVSASLLLSTTVSAGGQTRPIRGKISNQIRQNMEKVNRAAQSRPEEKSQCVYATAAFAPGVTSLPVYFCGHDIRELYLRLADRRLTQGKDEFETTEKYLERIRVIASQPVLGVLTTNDIFVFALKPLSLAYDADREIMRVTQPLFNMRKEGYGFDFSKASIPVLAEDNYRSYIGTNAFGVSVEIIEQTGNHYELALEKPVRFSLRFGDFQRDVSMDTGTAIRAKEDLRLLVICNLKAPFSDEVQLFEKPTVEHPTATNINYRYVFADLKEIWLFNLATGQIYTKDKAVEQ